MACRRSLSTKAALFTRWYHPSLSHISHHHDTDDAKYQPPCVDQVHSAAKIFLQQHVYNQNTYRTYRGIGAQYGYSKYFSYSPFLSVVGLPFCRQMSTTTGEGSDSVDYISDIAEVLTDKTVEVVSSQAPAINEVALAAADSAFPVAALQYLIDALHSLTGLNWWASIAITTVLIRGATLPFLINQLKATSKLNLIRPRLDEIKQVQESGMDPTAVAQGQKQMTALFKEHGVSPFTPLKGLLIQGPIFISFFFAIQNMVEKVPSFKVGGALWFTDLTTPDSLYILPVLTSLSFLITVECNMQEGLEGNPIAGTMKSFSRVLALLAIPFTAAFPKALFFYWMTANLFSLSYGLVLKHPEVRNFLDLPQALPPTTSNSPSTSTLKQYHTAEEPKQSSELAKCTDRRISSSSILRHRIRNLENQVKARKKNKKL